MECVWFFLLALQASPSIDQMWQMHNSLQLFYYSLENSTTHHSAGTCLDGRSPPWNPRNRAGGIRTRHNVWQYYGIWFHHHHSVPSSQKSKWSQVVALKQGVDAALPLCKNIPMHWMGGLKQKISMWVLPEVNIGKTHDHNTPNSTKRTKNTTDTHPTTSSLPYPHRNL